MKCGATSMDAVVRVATPFRGRVYAAGHPYDCYSVTITDEGYVTLSMPLHGRLCGTKNMVSCIIFFCFYFIRSETLTISNNNDELKVLVSPV